MQKRCRSELDTESIEFNTTFKANNIVLTTELFDENPQIWKELYNATKNHCDNSEHTCEEGYVWASPVGFKEKATTMEYTHQVTSCNSKKQYSFATSIYFVGLCLGPFVGGILADKIGRRPVCLAFGFILMLLNFYISVTKTPVQYAIGMLGIGLGTNGLANVNVLLMQESVSKELQFWPGMIYCAFCGVSCSLDALTAYLSPDWSFSYQVIGAIAGVLTLFNRFYLPESKLWAEGQNSYSKKSEKEPTPGIMDVFKSKMYTKRVFFSVFVWIAANIIYYGFAMNLNSLHGSIYLNTSINGMIEITGYVVIPMLFMNRLGRINTMLTILSIMLAMALGGMIVKTVFLTSLLRWIGALADCALFVALYTHTAECFPTSLRGQGLAIPDGLSRLPTTVTPFLGMLYEYNRSYFWLVNTGIIVVAMMACLFLPETEHIYPDSKSDCREQTAMIEI